MQSLFDIYSTEIKKTVESYLERANQKQTHGRVRRRKRNRARIESTRQQHDSSDEEPHHRHAHKIVHKQHDSSDEEPHHHDSSDEEPHHLHTEPRHRHTEPHHHHNSCYRDPHHNAQHFVHNSCDGERVVFHRARDRIVNKLHDVAQNLQSKIAADTTHRLEDYFTQSADGELIPKMFRIRNGEHIVNVPKFTLVNHSNIDLKEIKCKFRTDAFNLGIDCEDNFAVDTEVVFERNGNIDGYTRINELLIREYM